MSGNGHRYEYSLEIDERVREEADLYSKLAEEVVFWSPQLQHLEYKGNFLLKRMFQALTESFPNSGSEHGINFLPTNLSKSLLATSDERQRMRLLCDFLSGMTDGYAIRFYRRLFSPDVGLMNEEAVM